MARVEVFGNGTLDISDHKGMGVGSIEGDGVVLLAANTLTVGSNGMSTIFSGIIKEGGASGGSLAKTGIGTLTLNGASTYTGGTTVSQGTLVLSNTSGVATGTGSVLVNAGTLGGSGNHRGAWRQQATHPNDPKQPHLQRRLDLHLHLQSEAQQIQD